MKRILVPCDFSSEAINALRSAVEFARPQRAEIHVLHVIELPVIPDPLLMPVLTYENSLLEELKGKAKRTFDGLQVEFKDADIRPIYTTLFGPVSGVILSYIKEHSIELVVMGTKGASGIQEVLVGSNTEKIVRASVCPVLVVRQHLKLDAIRNIAFPTNIDFQLMEDLMQKVKALQLFFKATLHLVWINTPGNFSNDDITLARLHDFAKRYMLINFTTNIFNDKLEESGIIRFAHHINADLLIMATHGRKGLAHMFGGSLTEDVVNHADLPVWTLSLSENTNKVPIK
jgi:nucleotide-binding universal stress UspA family protein